MKTNLIIATSLLFTILLGCKKDNGQESIQCETINSDFLQTNWMDYGANPYSYASKEYNFNMTENDTFYMHEFYADDQMYSECGFQYTWDIYAKGTWDYTNNYLTLSGYYCDENFNKLTTSPCWHYIDTGAFYMEFYNISYCNDTLVFQNTSTDVWPEIIKLKKNN